MTPSSRTRCFKHTSYLIGAIASLAFTVGAFATDHARTLVDNGLHNNSITHDFSYFQDNAPVSGATVLFQTSTKTSKKVFAIADVAKVKNRVWHRADLRSANYAYKARNEKTVWYSIRPQKARRYFV